jgi:hypothetical protein
MQLLEAFRGVPVLHNFSHRLVRLTIGETITSEARVQDMNVFADLLVDATPRLLP